MKTFIPSKPRFLRSFTAAQFLNYLFRRRGGVFILLFVLGSAWQASAATRMILNLNDSGPGSFREILGEATSGDVVEFAVGGVLTLTNGEVVLDQSIEIRGLGADRSTVCGNTNSRLLRVVGGEVVVRDLSLVGGRVEENSGGAIFNGATLTLIGCSLERNVARGVSGFGGAIFNDGQLTVVDCSLWNNTARAGGAIFNAGSLSLRQSTLSGNRAWNWFYVGQGAALYNGGTATIESCTLTANAADYQGGAIFGPESDPLKTIILSSIVADNSAWYGLDIFGAAHSQGYNLVGVTNEAVFVPMTCDQTGSRTSPLSPLLGPLQDNGGPTPTHALLQGSPALDTGHSGGTRNDQRGHPRTFNFPNAADCGDGADIGATELGEDCQAGPVITVNSMEDSDDGCAGIAHCSLREAVAAAHSSTNGPVTIIFDDTVRGRILLSLGAIFIRTNLLILGPGADLLTLDAQRASRILVGVSGTATVTGLTLSNGLAFCGDGGAILNSAELTVERCVITGSAGSLGGGICNLGILVIRDSTMHDNDTCNGGGFYAGGAIYNRGQLTLLNSTLSGNGADNGGGGGLFNHETGQVVVRHCTITGNRARTFAGDAPGGGICNQSTGIVLVANSILGQNDADTAADFSGTLTSEDFNLLHDTNGCVLLGSVTRTILGLDPRLMPLANNGGPTPTCALREDSPAIDAGSCRDLPSDQRGKHRVADLPSVENADNGSDIGAFEFDVLQTGPLLVVTSSEDSDDGQCSVGHCSLREALVRANASSNQLTVQFANHILGSIDLMRPLPWLQGQTVIQGPGRDLLRIRRGTGEFRILGIESNAQVVVSGITLSHGRVPLGGGGGVVNLGTLALRDSAVTQNAAYDGGGILNYGSLLLSNSIVDGNGITYDGYGGGIYNAGGTIDLVRCRIRGNSAGYDLSDGGGLFNPGGRVTIDECEISGNLAYAGVGGGIYNGRDGQMIVQTSHITGNSALAGGGLLNEGGFLRLNSSTVVGNTAFDDDGGGAWLTGTNEISHCTFSGNHSDFSGGGLYTGGMVTLTSCTIARNFAFSGGGLLAGGTVHLVNTLVGENAVPTSGQGPDCLGELTSAAFSLIGQPVGCQVGLSSNLLWGAVARLGPLQNNGGPTATHALLPGSDALDAGHSGTFAVDQRGFPTPVDAIDQPDRPGSNGADIGSFEADATIDDGLPDLWENEHLGGIAFGPQDDVDGDGFTNAAEYEAGTHPRDSGSYLRINRIVRSGENVEIHFATATGKIYRLSHRPALADPAASPTIISQVVGTGLEEKVIFTPAGVDAVGFFNLEVHTEAAPRP